MSHNLSTSMKMKCHYDVLEVTMTCSNDEIKKQYKKLALKWHPDRNHGQEEVATMNFKEIASAYAVLNDPHERKWYDQHREAILRGGDGTNDGEDDETHLLNIWKYFNSTCYTSFNDDDECGFFRVYSGVFESIYKQELNYLSSNSQKNLNNDNPPPPFGTSFSLSEEFMQFYSYWDNFVTQLSFSWEDKYNVLDAPNRQTRRAMEKENTKFRDVAKKEFTLQVRSLSSHVKKRDVRYVRFEEEIQRKKLLEEEKKVALRTEQAERRKLAREVRLQGEQYTEEELQQRSEERKGAFLLADNDSDDESDSDIDSALYYTEAELYQKLQELKLDQTESNSRKTAKKGKKKKSGFCREQASYEDTGVELQNEDTNSTTKIFDETTTTDGISSSDLNVDNNCDTTTETAFSCIICEKNFKTESQLSQHITSKIHRKKAQEIQKKQQKSSRSTTIRNQET